MSRQMQKPIRCDTDVVFTCVPLKIPHAIEYKLYHDQLGFLFADIRAFPQLRIRRQARFTHEATRTTAVNRQASPLEKQSLYRISRHAKIATCTESQRVTAVRDLSSVEKD